jgi:ABC-type nickel/cobalt efflux system permease component RcnA
MEEPDSTSLVAFCLIFISGGVTVTAATTLQNTASMIIVGSGIVAAGSGAWILIQHRMKEIPRQTDA